MGKTERERVGEKQRERVRYKERKGDNVGENREKPERLGT